MVLKLFDEPEEPTSSSSIFGSGSFGFSKGTQMTVRVAPVEASVSPAPVPVPYMDPVLFDIARSAKKPLFTGRDTDWSDFMMDWEAYWARITVGNPRGDVAKLATFESCLDETTKRELVLMKRTNQSPTFNQFFTMLETRFRRNRQALMRENLQELRLPQHRATLEDWREFVVKFRFWVVELGDITEESAYTMLTEKLTPGMKHWLTDKELKEEKKHPSVEVVFPAALDESAAKTTVETLSSQTVKKIEHVTGNKWKVTWAEKDGAEKMLRLNGRMVGAQGQQGRLRVQQMETRLRTDEVITYITDRLETSERKSLKIPAKDFQQARRTNLVEFSEESAQVQEESTPPSSGRQTPSPRRDGATSAKTHVAPSKGTRKGGSSPVGEKWGRVERNNTSNAWCWYGLNCQRPRCTFQHPHVNVQGSGNGKGKGQGKGVGGKGKGEGSGRGISGKGGVPVQGVAKAAVL